MSDFYVHRAMQIAGLESWQVIDLHARENAKGYCLANFEIQNLFALPTIKERFNIPDDNSLQATHAARVRTMLLSKSLAKPETLTVDKGFPEERVVILKPWESLAAGRLEAVHAFDNAVLDAVSDGSVSFAFESGATPVRKRERSFPSRVLAS